MNIHDLSPAQIERITVSVHEAGHAVVGAVYGATVERAALTADGSDGQCAFPADSFGVSAHAYRSHIAAAGAVAAAMFHHGRRPTARQMDNHLYGSDRDELRAAAFTAVAPMHAPLQAVQPVVLQHWAAIVDLATGMYFGNEIGHAHVCAALGLSDEGGPYSAELARIRSGGVPRRLASGGHTNLVSCNKWSPYETADCDPATH